jgi:hypothetical protein
MNDTVFISRASQDELEYYKKLHSSIEKFCKGRVDIHLYVGSSNVKFPRDWIDVPTTVISWSRKRSEAILDAFKRGYRTVVFVRHNMEFTETPYDLLGFCNDYRPGVFDQAYITWTHGIISPFLIGYRNVGQCLNILEQVSDYDIIEGTEDIYGLTRIKIAENHTDLPIYLRDQREQE